MGHDAASLSAELAAKGIRDERVLEAVATVPRAAFVPPGYRDLAYLDRPLPIGHGQTISQPYVVARMTEALRLAGPERVLEVGTGSGYQTAILAALCATVYSVEVVPGLAGRAREVLLGTLGLPNVELRTGDGSAGWPDAAPFDAILLAAAPKAMPDVLRDQLRAGGRMVLPVGADPLEQRLVLVTRGSNGVDDVEQLLPVRFVPLVDDHGRPI